jgi:hypothetical protein
MRISSYSRSRLSLADFGYQPRINRRGHIAYYGIGDDTTDTGNVCDPGQVMTAAGCADPSQVAGINQSLAVNQAYQQGTMDANPGTSGSNAGSVGAGGGSTGSSSIGTSILGILQSGLGITGAVLGTTGKPGAVGGVRPVAPAAGMGIGTMLLLGLVGVGAIGGIAYFALRD